MLSLIRRSLVWSVLIVFAVAGWAKELTNQFKLNNGDSYTGYAAAITDDGLVVRLEKGGFSPLVPWGRLSQETLVELANDTNATKFAIPFIEKSVDEKQRERAQKKEVRLKDVPRVDLPDGKQKFLPSLGTPIGFLILISLYLANLYAAVEIARFRSRPVFVVVGVSMLFPVLGPLLYLFVPDEASDDEGLDHSAQPAVGAVEEKKATPGALGVAGHGKVAVVDGGPQTFKRSDTTFDRRFFETKFSGFFRMVASDGDKDKVLVFRTPKADYIARRISRISATEIHIQMLQGATEVGVPFTSISEVILRHKDAK